MLQKFASMFLCNSVFGKLCTTVTQSAHPMQQHELYQLERTKLGVLPFDIFNTCW